MSDKACTAVGKLCDLSHDICVDCRTTADCTGSAVCVSGNCVAVKTCVNSRDCAANQVCDSTLGHCVECSTANDCSAGSTCSASTCHPVCASDKSCAPYGLLCDTTHGFCVDCLKDADCSSTSHCDSGTCQANVCAPLSTTCSDSQVFVCDSQGAGYVGLACAYGCSSSGGGAHCLGSGGSGAGGCTGSSGATETLTVGDCGNAPTITKNRYSGHVLMTVSGVELGGSGQPYFDAFYLTSSSDPSVLSGTCAANQCLYYNHPSEGSCTCPVDCPNLNHRLVDLLTQPPPPFNSAHSYTVELDFGTSAPDYVNFGIADCGCYDNSGSFTLTLTQLGC